jgi:hypothetical protein
MTSQVNKTNNNITTSHGRSSTGVLKVRQKGVLGSFSFKFKKTGAE